MNIADRVALCVIVALCAGCSQKPSEEAESIAVSPAVRSHEVPLAATPMIPAEEMRKNLGANQIAQFQRSGAAYTAASLAGSGATTLEGLRGQPLKELDLSLTKISDLGPIQGMPLKKLVLIQAPVSDLSPIAGMPLVLLDASESLVADVGPVSTLGNLQELYLEKAQVSEISPLKDLSIKKLWLSHCPVRDLSPLAGKTFEELNLCDTLVEDFSPLASMKIGTLWLRGTGLADLTVISEIPLKSLDVQKTAVTDLSPISKMTSLERLNIADTEVTDLTPLQGLALTRLVFTPEKITRGMDVIRNMKSLRQLDTSFDGAQTLATPSEFWERFDRMNSKAETPP
ncbi:leucine-rich repeat domain-containing protein [Planctomicrobium sp. SH661]|uniref:leucine-rich repeat domain-containing protein n=1 Tax=Planctomicrobium sp. SH661 TaxID=3448124 RepID=UPI003F5BAD52